MAFVDLKGDGNEYLNTDQVIKALSQTRNGNEGTTLILSNGEAPHYNVPLEEALKKLNAASQPLTEVDGAVKRINGGAGRG